MHIYTFYRRMNTNFFHLFKFFFFLLTCDEIYIYIYIFFFLDEERGMNTFFFYAQESSDIVQS